eukprot:TCALIF_08561-PA protein Name:"Similar to Amy4N Alpha-amylase 4N (Drosophila ananassae)" AED:0.15 eAED:0.16 QI:12/0.75/0.55/1/1/0.88/9/0/728
MRLLVALTTLLAIFGSIEAFVDPHCDGKQVVVHLFEWKWTDVALECERFLAPAGYCGVQISPPHEHVFLPEDNCPWWQRYQLVSYQLESRSGTRDQFVDMVQRCNAVGVRIFADVILNHAAGMGRKGPGFAGTDFDTTDDKHDFPGIPYSDENFTPRELCPSDSGSVDNDAVEDNVRNCYLVGLSDLYGAQEYVQEKQADYLNDMIDIGVAGFRVDAAKHMWAEDIAAIQALLKPLNVEQGFKAGSQPFFMHEVIDRDDGVVRVQEYYDLGIVTEFRYSQKMAWASTGDWGQFGGLYDPGWGMSDPEHAFVFVDNHDNQRGHGGSGDVVTFKDGKLYAYAVSAMLASEYGFTRVMSSYDFDNSDQGPPSLDDFVTSDVTINEDGSCGGGWVCEHRWNAIAKMVQFRNAVAGAPQEHFWSEGNSMGFSRTGKGFFAMSQASGFNTSVKTGLPAGNYCNIIDSCASSVMVKSDGLADISITNDEGIIAICVGCEGRIIGLRPTITIRHDMPNLSQNTQHSAVTETGTEYSDSTKDYADDTTGPDGTTQPDYTTPTESTRSPESTTSTKGTTTTDGTTSTEVATSTEDSTRPDYTTQPEDSTRPDYTTPTYTDGTTDILGECCSRIEIESFGGIGSELPEIQGQYHMISNTSSIGQPDYLHESGAFYLYYRHYGVFYFKGWLISSDRDSYEWIALTQEPFTRCVEDFQFDWEYFLDYEWIKDAFVDVTCLV